MLLRRTTALFRSNYEVSRAEDDEATETAGRMTTYDFVRSHREEVGHERREAWSQTALCDEAKLELRQTHGVIAALPVPARYVQQIRLATNTPL